MRISYLLCAIGVFSLGCEQEDVLLEQFDTATIEINENVLKFVEEDVLLSETQAMSAAMAGLDPDTYEATSTIVGPMEHGDGQIMAYEVTLRAQDHIRLRYVNATTGEVVDSEEAIHPVPIEPDPSQPGAPPPAYYRSCNGMVLCIADPDTIGFYSQRDPSWRNTLLGYSNSSTIGNYGCLLSSYAMALLYTGNGSRNPRQLNTLGQNNGCFSGDLIVNSCLVSAAGGSYSTIGVNQVWSTIASGIPVTAYGYSTCMGSNHAQMIWGHNGARYITKDPWYDWTNQDQDLCMNNPSYRVIR